MTTEHANILLLKRLDLGNLTSCADLFAPDFVFHYFNPKLPDIHGDYVGLSELQTFFKNIRTVSAGSFKVNPISATAVGDELVVVHVRNSMTIQDQNIKIDAVVVWRFVGGHITEAWDIPSVYTSA